MDIDSFKMLNILGTNKHVFSKPFIVPQYLYSQIENTVNLVVIILQAALSECVPKTFDVSFSYQVIGWKSGQFQISETEKVKR